MHRLIALVTSFVIVVSAASAPAQDSIRPAKVFTVVEAESQVRRSYPALVLPSQEVELSFRVGGRVIQLPIRAAMDIEAGDMVAELDLRDFESQIAQLESQRDQALAQLTALRSGARSEEIAALEAGVEAAQAQVDQAQEQAERTRQLVERGVVASARQEQDDAALRVALAQLQSAQEQLAIGRAGGRAEDIAAAEAALRGVNAQLKVARDNLDDATLTAPFTGIVARRHIENFTLIQPGQSIILLQALETLHLIFDVPGPDVTALTTGGQENITAQVMFDALPDAAFDAEIVEFSVQADTASQTYRGRAAVPHPDDSTILPGMVGRVIITAPGFSRSIMIPLTAVASSPEGKPFVWIVDTEGLVSKRDVTIGEASGDMVAALEGLSGGDVIVSAGVSQILEGMKVRPITKVGE